MEGTRGRCTCFVPDTHVSEWIWRVLAVSIRPKPLKGAVVGNESHPLRHLRLLTINFTGACFSLYLFCTSK